MPPARPRPVDDSRSETSSIITNLKEKMALAAGTGAGVSKNKRQNYSTLNGPSKLVLANVASGAAAGEADHNLPKTDWPAMPTAILHSYRAAYHISTPSAYTHPHADIIYNSSDLALRAPSAVLARRKFRHHKHTRRKTEVNGNPSSKSRGKDKEKEGAKEKEKDPDTTALPAAATDTSSSVAAPPNPSIASATTATSLPEDPPIDPLTIGRQPPTGLATAIRKHFNAQQMHEAETVARFLYVARASAGSRGAVRTEGSEGDGKGWWIGSQGREVRRCDGPGGEGGFRLRFRP